VTLTRDMRRALTLGIRCARPNWKNLKEYRDVGFLPFFFAMIGKA